jgi:acetolactate synthase-1/3 small subunit
MKKIFKITVENQPGVLYRLVNVFYKRKINISAVNAFETKNKSYSQVLITVEVDPEMMEKIKKQIEKIVEVINVK